MIAKMQGPLTACESLHKSICLGMTGIVVECVVGKFPMLTALLMQQLLFMWVAALSGCTYICHAIPGLLVLIPGCAEVLQGLKLS